MNSPEIDYQFLVNALYYFEEKYPTRLSLYNYKEYFEALNYISNVLDKNVERDLIESLNLSNINITVNPNSGQKIKMFNYFNPLKAKTTKMNLLEKIVDERIANLKKAIEEGIKVLNAKSANANTTSNTNLSNTFDANLDSIKDRIIKLRAHEAYQMRIKDNRRNSSNKRICNIRTFNDKRISRRIRWNYT
jgi:hypothetical protein